ncbi:Iron(3+)-hydroxamate import system permease FhuB [Klebsiella pneumoniae]|nr:Iron(3+)-hydroxamate import system permease FhuB [Klebsiella pneumoniae]
MNTRLSPLAIILLAGLLGVAFALSIVNLNVALPYAQWRQALWQPDVDDIAQMLFHYSLLPRLAVALLVGAGLGLVGVLFQQVLRNPLAEPTTLGVATGAQLGITVTTLWAIPGVLASQFAALAGACLVGALVFGVSWGKRLSPVTLILAGLVVSLYCGALNQLMVIFHHDQLQSMFLWSTGTLTQTDWSVAQRLWPQLLGGAILTLLLLRPLTLMGLDDGVARNLGLALSLARLGALTLAIVISALLVNAVGIIGFIGLFAPLLAKMLGARRLLARLLLAALIGALLLWLSDQVILWLSRVWREVSTGSVTALIGAPLLLWLLPRLRSISAPVMNGGDNVQPERYHVQWFVLAGVALLLLAVSVALAAGAVGAVRRGHAGGRRLYYPAPDRQPDGQPGSAGHQLRRGFWRGADAVLRAWRRLWLAAAGRQPWRGGHLADHYACRRARRLLAASDAAGGDGAEHRLHYAADDAAGQRRSAYGADPDVDLGVDI